MLEPLLAEHRGRLFKTMGDGFLADFASAVEAVACAMALQTQLAEQTKKGCNYELAFTRPSATYRTQHRLSADTGNVRPEFAVACLA